LVLLDLLGNLSLLFIEFFQHLVIGCKNLVFCTFGRNFRIWHFFHGGSSSDIKFQGKGSSTEREAKRFVGVFLPEFKVFVEDAENAHLTQVFEEVRVPPLVNLSFYHPRVCPEIERFGRMIFGKTGFMTAWRIHSNSFFWFLGTETPLILLFFLCHYFVKNSFLTEP
jgi:hypothetical protein